MPITLKDIRDHYDYHGITALDELHTAEYRKLLNNFAFFFMDTGGNLRHTFSDEILATNIEQMDALIDKLKEFKEIMDDTPDWMSEK